MILSIFLAKLIGLYLLILAAAWIIRKKAVNHSFEEIISSKGLIAFSGLMNILLGLAIAIGHPIWQFSWVVLITVLGYVMILKGLMRLLFTEKTQKFMLNAIRNRYWVMIAVLVVLGGILTYCGFMMS